MAGDGKVGDSARENTQNHDYTSNVKTALGKAGVDDETILKLLDLGVSDFSIPMLGDSSPIHLAPGASCRFEGAQQRYLKNEFEVKSGELLDHFNLHSDAISEDTHMPKTLEYMSNIGRSNNTDVTKVKCTSGIRALKRIKRLKNGASEELEQMNYIKGELSILRKIHRVKFRHFVKLTASYTDADYVGMLLSPAADCNLASYLDNFQPSNRPLLEEFFGCLATALAHLHYVEHIRHKDIKPANILVKGNNVLLTDFGISLDWSTSLQTTTDEEKRKTPKYCAPEVHEDKPRNSKSDIWSLGCVFLEMFTVLKGEKRSYVDNFLNQDGPPKYCTSQQAIKDLLANLKTVGSGRKNKPLDWIKKMLKWTKEDRPNARILRKEILENGYCGICCKHDKIFKDLPPNAPSKQGAPTTSPSIPSQHTMETYALTIKFLSGFKGTPQWREIEVIHIGSISKCWISPDVLHGSELKLRNNESGESFTLDGKMFKSNKHAEITCKSNNIKSTLTEKFFVATEATPFDMLVPTSTFNQMRQLNNSNR
ncbi:kinase-like protein [Annulohypoxylon truncatum]|uniref:kinase-like protein n=1 Tax=Annulohypoxylon truncatum TaxID=327061 RepID=UPI002008006E|nr:kinase-like protein [Annulohypoxylon truncatum]KAI1210053.1 kinase-like protein [Annulohypoxylon truncatum]